MNSWLFLRPVRRKENTLKSQWELKVKPTKLSNARENAGNQVVIGFSIASDWLRKWREFLDGSQSEVKQNQSDPGLLLVLEGFIYPWGGLESGVH